MLLLSDADRTDAAASLLPDVLHMLATTHAELGKYRRAAEYFNRALAACNTIYGKGHVRCCPVLRGWARMAVRRQQDHTLAVQLLRKEKDVREAHMGRLTLTLALTLALNPNPNPSSPIFFLRCHCNESSCTCPKVSSASSLCTRPGVVSGKFLPT